MTLQVTLYLKFYLMINTATIFVSVASYRDPETFMTVSDLLGKAKHPERVYVGVLSQIDRRKESTFLAPFGKRIRQEVMDYKDSKGVCWARSRILTKLREKEEFVFQIDSHSRFKKDWDTTLLTMYNQIGNYNAVISYYPPNYTPGKEIDYNDNSYIYFLIKELRDPGIPRYSSGVLPFVDRHINDCKTIGVAGGCIFGHRSVFDRVPYDPNLYFFGEEPSYHLRLFTHGIDSYAPNNNFMYHYYNVDTDRNKRVLHWDDHNSKVNQYNYIAYDRLRYLFNLGGITNQNHLKDINKYGLGRVRTLQEWQQKLNIDLKKKHIGESAKTKIFY